MLSPHTDDPRLLWRKSSRSSGGGNECVEVADLPGTIAVRDSKNPDGPKLTFARAEWRRFADRVKTGTLDL